MSKHHFARRRTREGVARRSIGHPIIACATALGVTATALPFVSGASLSAFVGLASLPVVLILAGWLRLNA